MKQPPLQPSLKVARLVGERVELRGIVPADAAACFALIHDKREITDWLVWDGPDRLEDLEPWYKSWRHGDVEAGFDYHLAIIDPVDGCFSGSIGVRFAGHPFRGDLGYWLDSDRWGRGMVGEAVAMVTWLAFEQLEAQLVFARLFDDNHASRKVLERNGFVEDPAGRIDTTKRGQPRCELFFGLSRTEWIAGGRSGAPREVHLEVDE